MTGNHPTKVPASSRSRTEAATAIELPEPSQPKPLQPPGAERMRYCVIAQQAVTIEGDRWTRCGTDRSKRCRPAGCLATGVRGTPCLFVNVKLRCFVDRQS